MKPFLQPVIVFIFLLHTTYAQHPFFATECTIDASICQTEHGAETECAVADDGDPATTVDPSYCRCNDASVPYDTSDPANPVGLCVPLRDFFDTPCATEDDCNDGTQTNHRNAVCKLRNIELDATDPASPQTVNVMMCQCKPGWKPSNLTDPDNPQGICQLQAELNDECWEDNDPPDSVCVTENAVCKDDGYNQGTTRCLCEDGYRKYYDETQMTNICARILKAQDYDVCEDCEKNRGVCFSKVSNMTVFEEDPANNYGCKCPITQVTSASGEDCGKSLVDVTCNVEHFTMTVCYEPHIDITNEDFIMFADEYGTVEACKGVAISADDQDTGCPSESRRKLILELHSDKIQQCGVVEYKHLQKITFEKTIVVRNNADLSSVSDSGEYYFDVYCSMATQTNSRFDAFGVRGVPGNDQGEHLEPDVSFRIFNILGQELAEGVSLQIDDEISFRIDLEADGTYAAIHVLRCTASTSPKIPDEDADTAVLLIDSCPAPNQPVFTADNIWRMVANQPNVLETGLVPAFKLPRGSDVFMHCTARLCLLGDEASCGVVSCDGTNSVGKRRKRQAENEENIELVTRMTFEEDAEQSSGKVVMDTVGFALMLTVLLIMLVVLAALLILLFFKLRSRGSYVEDVHSPPNKPQKFALPRIGNAAMRM